MPQNPVILVPYSPQWPLDFHALASRIRSALGPLALRIDHIGSTSVPNLCSKDIIDIQLTVADLQHPSLILALTAAGFEHRPHVVSDHIPPGHPAPPADWQKLYFRNLPNTRTAHLHVRLAGKPNQRYALLFRDYLRTHPSAASAYSQIKHHLAPVFASPDYSDAKDPVCDLIIQSAEMWASQTLWSLAPSDA